MEGLGAAASVIAVASLALQLAESVKHLCEFWASIQDAPSSVREVVDELKMLSMVISKIASPVQAEVSNPELSLVLQTCATQIGTLISMTQKLEREFASTSKAKRKWVAVKAVFKADKVDKFREAIERTKTTLLLAHQQHILMTISAGLEAQRRWSSAMTPPAVLPQLSYPRPYDEQPGYSNEAKLHEIVDSSQYDGEIINSAMDRFEAPKPRCRRVISRSSTSLRTILGAFSLQSEKFVPSPSDATQSANFDVNVQESPESTHSILILHPATWLSGFGVEYGIRLAVFQSPGSWKHVLQTFRPVPDDSLIFQFCAQGNVDGVRLLLSRGEASVWDTNSAGETALHCAAGKNDLRLCEALLNAGADREALAHNNTSCFGFACYAGYSNRVDVIRLFLDQIDVTNPNMNHTYLITSIFNLGAGGSKFPYGQSSFAWLIKGHKSIFGSIIDSHLLSLLLDYASTLLAIEDVWALLADLDMANTAYGNRFCWTPLHHYLYFQDYASATSLVQQNAFTHSIGQKNNLRPFNKETPTSLSLYSSKAFFAWQKILQNERVSIQEFVVAELQNDVLKSKGWNEGSLLEIFGLDFQPTLYPDRSCERCCCITTKFGLVEVAWQRILWHFRNHIPEENSLPSRVSVEQKAYAANCSVNDEMLQESFRLPTGVTNQEPSPKPTPVTGQAQTDINEVLALISNNKDLGVFDFGYDWVCNECWYYLLRNQNHGSGHGNDGNAAENNVNTESKKTWDGDAESDSDDSPFLLSI